MAVLLVVVEESPPLFIDDEADDDAVGGWTLDDVVGFVMVYEVSLRKGVSVLLNRGKRMFDVSRCDDETRTKIDAKESRRLLMEVTS